MACQENSVELLNVSRSVLFVLFLKLPLKSPRVKQRVTSSAPNHFQKWEDIQYQSQVRPNMNILVHITVQTRSFLCVMLCCTCPLSYFPHRFPPAGAILPLALGLIITALLLLMIGCRLRLVRHKLKKARPLTTEESDYLINGMYL